MQYIQERPQGCASVRAVGGEPIAAAAVGRRPPQDLLGKEQIRMETRWGSAEPQSSWVHFLGPPDQSAQGEARQAWAMCAKEGLGPSILTCLGDAGLPSNNLEFQTGLLGPEKLGVWELLGESNTQVH